MKPYTFKQSVAFSDHNFQSRIGDTCVFHSAKESLVIYREDSLIAQFPLRKIALEAMEQKGWLVPTVETKVVVTAPPVEEKKEEKIAAPESTDDKKEEEPIKDVEKVDENQDDGVDEESTNSDTDNTSDGDLEEDEPEVSSLEVVEEPKKRKGGRPKKVQN